MAVDNSNEMVRRCLSTLGNLGKKKCLDDDARWVALTPDSGSSPHIVKRPSQQTRHAELSASHPQGFLWVSIHHRRLNIDNTIAETHRC